MAGSWSIYIGNQFCDDYINKAECNFDAGDCCGPNANTYFCSDCQCLVNEGCYLNSTQRCKMAFFGWVHSGYIGEWAHIGIGVIQ